MKRRPRRALILLLLGAARLAAAEPQPVIIDYRVYVAPQEHAFPLMKELRSAGANAAVRRLNQLTIDGDARLAGVTKIHALSGVKADHSSGEEKRWPIEWSPPNAFKFGTLLPRGERMSVHAEFAMWESRDLGPRVEVTAELDSDTSKATLALNAGISRLDGWFRPPAAFTAGAVALSFPQPRFASSRIATRVTVPLRRWTLVSAQTDAKKPGLIILHTIRATTPGADLAPADRQP